MTGYLYVRKNNSDVIYTVSGTKAACFELTRAELFGAFNPAGLTASEIEAVSYTLADGETVTLKSKLGSLRQKSGSNVYQTVWRLAGDTAADLDENKGGCHPLALFVPMSRHRQQMPTRRRMVLRPRWSQQRSPQPMAE